MRLLPILFSCILAVAAFLSFSIQPILGKMLLPLVGGSPAGWITAMAFFQLALLAGYGVSYAMGRLNVWWHFGGLLALYAMGFFFLPPTLPALPDNLHGSGITFAVVGVLARAIFVPYLALAATTSALQRLFASTTHPTAHDQYYLFVASNIGSFAGLLCYPLYLELFHGLHWQAGFWQIVYGVAIVLIGLGGMAAWLFRAPPRMAKTDNIIAPVTPRQIGLWLALSFVPCSMSMGVTNLITTNVAALPLFWVIPLGLYLLTFILAFAAKPRRTLKNLGDWHVNMVGFLVCLVTAGLGFKPYGDIMTFGVIMFFMLEVFFVTAWFCHQRLATLRPDAGRLTLFYFIVALGGALAGVMHAFVLPFVLKEVIEFPIVALLSLLLNPVFYQLPATLRRLGPQWLYPVCAVVATIAGTLIILHYPHIILTAGYVGLAVLFIIPFLMIASRPRLLLVVGGSLVLLSVLIPYTKDRVLTGRNFFGAYTVQDEKADGMTIRYFAHGNTQHGMAIYNASDDITFNSSYYMRQGPINDILRIAHAQTLGVIGLGVGQMACLAPQLHTDFYEIDPDVAAVARDYFPYLHDCPIRHLLIGDGRLELARTDYTYNVLMLDAFTSDGIPLHILTREAIALYKRHVAADGIILFHISNNFFDLAPPIAAAAAAENLTAYEILYKPDLQKYPFGAASRWLALPTTEDNGKALQALGWHRTIPASKVWTDDYSSMIGAMTFVGLH